MKSDATLKDVPTKPKRVEFVFTHEFVVSRDVPSGSSFESCMELRNMSIFAAKRDFATTKPTMEEFVSHMVQQRSVNWCGHEGCTNFVQKGGVCITHGAGDCKVTMQL